MHTSSAGCWQAGPRGPRLMCTVQAKKERETADQRGPPPEASRAFRLPMALVPDMLSVWELLQVQCTPRKGAPPVQPCCCTHGPGCLLARQEALVGSSHPRAARCSLSPCSGKQSTGPAEARWRAAGWRRADRAPLPLLAPGGCPRAWAARPARAVSSPAGAGRSTCMHRGSMLMHLLEADAHAATPCVRLAAPRRLLAWQSIPGGAAAACPCRAAASVALVSRCWCPKQH